MLSSSFKGFELLKRDFNKEGYFFLEILALKKIILKVNYNLSSVSFISSF